MLRYPMDRPCAACHFRLRSRCRRPLTRPLRWPHMRSALPIVGVVVTILLAGCGGGGHKSQTTTSTTTTHSSTGKTSPPPTPLSESVSVSGTKKAAPSSSASAAGGTVASFVTRVPGKRGSHPVDVHLDFAQVSSTKWTATASVKKQQATATLTSKDGKQLKLEGFRYACALPPVPSFCPPTHVHTTSGHVSVQFSAAPATPIVVGSQVAPAPSPVVLTPPSTQLAPTYTIATTVLGIPAKRSKSAPVVKPASTVAVHPGDTAAIRITVTGSVVGAPQPLTVNFAQGPSKSIDVSASVPGGPPSTATITSASGGPIALVSPRYTCFLPPYPTFCPASHITAKSHKYALTLNAIPKVPVVITLLVQRG
jgi:hypothetical protein